MPTFTGSDGATLYYDDRHDGAVDGERLPVIALAGGAALHPSYLGDLAGLGGHGRLIVPHLRGVGRSPLPASPQLASFWRQAEDVERLRVHLGLERVLLLGHSAGTRLAISYAAQFPHRLAGMVLVTPPAAYLVDEPSDTQQIVDRRRGDPAFDAALTAWAAGPGDGAVVDDAVVDGAVVDDAVVDDAVFNAWQQRVAPLSYAVWGESERAHAAGARYSFAANRAYFSVDPPPDLAARLGDATAAVLVVAGAQDCSVGVTQVSALARLFPAGEVVVIERCGHHPWVEQPTAFRQAVDRFLRALPRHRPGAG